MKVKIGDEEVVLDQTNLQLDETTLNDFLKNFASLYSYYNAKWAKSQYLYHCAEDALDVKYGEKFVFYKENEGGSDKLVESKAKMHPEVVTARMAARQHKYVMQLMFTYLRSLDKVQENALNLGYNIRKELDKLFPQSIRGLDDMSNTNTDQQIDELFRSEDQA